jgi:hypothetical protein
VNADWTRRQVLSQLGFTSPALLLLLSRFAIADEGDENGFNTSQPTNELIWSSEWENQQPVYVNSEFNRNPDVNEQLGSEYRPPGASLLKLDSVHSSATNTPQTAPGAISVGPDVYSADSPNRAFMNDADSFLAGAIDKVKGSAQYHLFKRPVELPGSDTIKGNLQQIGSQENYLASLFDAISRMRNSGAWNYKRTVGASWKDAGDFNYGVISDALGVPQDLALRFAGLYAMKAGTHVPEWGAPWDIAGNYGHDPHAQQVIREAYEYYDNRELIDQIYDTPPSNQYHLLPESEMSFSPK